MSFSVDVLRHQIGIETIIMADLRERQTTAQTKLSAAQTELNSIQTLIEVSQLKTTDYQQQVDRIEAEPKPEHNPTDPTNNPLEQETL